MMQVSKDFVRSVLQDRFNRVGNLHNDAGVALWDEYLEMLLDMGEFEGNSAMDVVDNFLVNGNFIYRGDKSDEEWNEIRNEALISDEKYALGY